MPARARASCALTMCFLRGESPAISAVMRCMTGSRRGCDICGRGNHGFVKTNHNEALIRPSTRQAELRNNQCCLKARSGSVPDSSAPQPPGARTDRARVPRTVQSPRPLRPASAGLSFFELGKKRTDLTRRASDCRQGVTCRWWSGARRLRIAGIRAACRPRQG